MALSRCSLDWVDNRRRSSQTNSISGASHSQRRWRRRPARPDCGSLIWNQCIVRLRIYSLVKIRSLRREQTLKYTQQFEPAPTDSFLFPMQVCHKRKHTAETLKRGRSLTVVELFPYTCSHFQQHAQGAILWGPSLRETPRRTVGWCQNGV